MNWYIYWYYANVYFFNLLIGWMAKGKGLAVYLLISFSPLYAFYAFPFMVFETYFDMTIMPDKYIYRALIIGIPAIHLSIFYPGSKRYAKWENEYRRCCTDGKNLSAILFSLCCIAGCAICSWR